MRTTRWTAVAAMMVAAVGNSAGWAALSVPAGFRVETVASGLPTALRGVAVAPAEFGEYGGQIFIGNVDLNNHCVLRVDSSGNVSTFTSGVGRPVFLAFGPGGVFGYDLYVSNHEGFGPENAHKGLIQAFSPAGTVLKSGTQTPAGSGESGTALAFSQGGDFGAKIYSGTTWIDCLSTVTPDLTQPTVFHNYGDFNGGPRGLAFGSGQGGFSSNLYVALSTPSGRPGRGIYVYDSSGNEQSSLITTADLGGIPYDLAFGPGGAFGTDLFVSLDGEYGGRKIVRVDSAGHHEDFATGFSSTFGLAFDGRNSLYAVDSGTGTLYRISPVPEPITVSLLLLGWLCIGGKRRYGA